MELPPPGSPETIKIASYVNSLVEESSVDVRRIAWEAEATRSFNLFLGNHYTTSATDDAIRLVLNRIQNAIVSLVAIQSADPPQITFTPRETGEPPVTYLNTNLPEAQKVIAGMEIDAEQPLPDAVAQHLSDTIDQHEMIAAQSAAAGLPKPAGLLPRELLVEITDQTTADALQTIFDAGWEECDGAAVYAENILNKNVIGWQPTLYEWDAEQGKHVLTNVHGRQIFPDPLHTDSSRWEYAIYDQPVSKFEAMKKWPHLGEKIEVNARAGNIRWPSGKNYESASMFDQYFQREMIVVRTAWIRCQPYPMAPAEAIQSGKVREVMQPTGTLSETLDPETGAILETPDVRPTLMLPSEDVETDPNQPTWPIRYGIRQITVVVDESVEDVECKFPEIPLPTNRNIPIPFSPYGQSEPKRLEDLNMAINRILSGMVNHHAYTAYNPELVAESVIDRMDEALKKGRSRPGQRIGIPQDLVEMVQGDLSKLVQSLDVPAMPTDFWKLLDLLLGLIDKEGNQTDVMQGDAAASWSGETVKSLQNAASQVIRGKSMFTEFYLKNLARLFFHSIVHFMSAEEWKAHLGRHPWQAIQALHDRAKRLHVDIGVKITSGSGASETSDTQALVQARQMGVPVSDPTLMERLKLDPSAEQQKQSDWVRKQAMQAAQMPMQPGPAQPPQA